MDVEGGEVTIPSSSRLYFDFGDDCYNHEMKEKGILWRIFFSPLTRKKAFIISCIAVSIDPLFFYIPVIDEKNKCLGIDKRLKTAALCLRALPDAAFALHTINYVFILVKGLLIRVPWAWLPELGAFVFLVVGILGILGILVFSFIHILLGGFLILPIPQLAILVFFFKSGGSGHFGRRVTTLNVFLVMHYPARVFLIYRFSKYLKNKTKTGVQAALYFFFYVLSSHVLGGFWYFFSIQREISCWHQFCKNAISCGAIDYCSGSTSRNITFLNELCPSNPPNATVFNFGIFLDAIQYGITRSMHFPTKFFYRVWWGVRNLSNFGTNMQTSSYVWENCFAIIVSLIGLLLFLYLLGNLQIYMQQALQKSLDKKKLGRKIDKKKKKIQKCMKMHGISDDTVGKILCGTRENKLEKNIDGEVDVNYIFYVLYESERRLMCQDICWKKLKKVGSFPLSFLGVKELQHMNDEALEMICNYLKPKIFKENEMVVEAGHPLNAMLIIIAGFMQAYLPIRDVGDAHPSTSFETLDKGMFVGEQLLDWAAKTKTLGDQPVSFKTIRCSKKVEAFALTVDDLKTLVHIKGIFLMSKVGFLNIHADDWRIREKRDAILLWMGRNDISVDVVVDIMQGFSKNKLEEKIDDEVDVNYIFSVFEEYERSIMRRYFCMEALKKVRELQHMNDRALGMICDCLKPKVFEENAKVVEVGEPLNALLYIIAGSMKVYLPIIDAGEAAPSNSFDTLEKGMFVGEQLLYWAMKTKAFDDQPASFKTIQCTKKVEAFALTVDDLKTLALSGDIFPMKFKGDL
ncbi:PREDICTED: cyclic nucleotide-gated ion channel 1-like [Prunus mume]|uniref:Cyclic nucleotide-gated ion channel 1-like n=1 Tax=Prunus mume TaxID=102107 RepID=A0ABM0NJU4_PRUMU|nr:PREDICTED: cyclic nucleotide-gated ion channel 1-like [Prunus mume]